MKPDEFILRLFYCIIQGLTKFNSTLKRLSNAIFLVLQKQLT